MDLLNNSTAAPTKQVNNLIAPKTNNLMTNDSVAMDADDEESPVRLPKPDAEDGETENQFGLQEKA